MSEQELKTVRFDCHGQNAPAYGCNRPGDQSGEYVRADVVRELIAALECEEALHMRTEKGVAVLERHGWRYADRYDLSAAVFVDKLRRSALARAKGERT